MTVGGPASKPRAMVYVDGFNFYNGCFRRNGDWPYAKWLDLSRYFRLIYGGFDICHIHYFSALVVPTHWNPGAQDRQLMYWRALRTLPDLTLHEGVFYQHAKTMFEANPPFAPVVVNKIEEKQTDVHLASRMLVDAFQGNCDVSILVTNDSDLVAPVRILTQELGRAVYVLNPRKKPAYHLMQVATEIRSVRLGAMTACQFPDQLHDANGVIDIPLSWKKQATGP